MPFFVGVVSAIEIVAWSIAEAEASSSSNATPSVCATSNCAPEAMTATSGSWSLTLKRAALPSLRDVTHTVPSSSLTCRSVTELTMNAPMMTAVTASRQRTGVSHGRPSALSIDRSRMPRS